jgi:hypothetical protein
MLGVLLLVVQGFVINRLAGVPYPVWSPSSRPEHLPGFSSGHPSVTNWNLLGGWPCEHPTARLPGTLSDPRW